MTVEIDKLVAELEKIENDTEFKAWKTEHQPSIDLVRGLMARLQDLVNVDPKIMLRLSEWTLFIALSLDDAFSRALAHRARAVALHGVDEYFQSIEHFDLALAIFRDLGDDLEIAKTLTGRSVSYLKVSRFDEALADADWVTRTFERLGDERRLARHLDHVAHIYLRLDRLSDMMNMLDRAESILLRIGDRKLLSVIYANRAVGLTTLNRAPEAFRYYEQARQLAVENGLTQLAAQCDYNICYLYFLQGQYTRALELLNAVRKRVNEAGDRWLSALCNLDQSEIYLELNMHKDAIELAEQAYAGFEAIGMSYEMAKTVAFMGIANNHLHNYGKALELFDRSRRMFMEQKNEVWLSLVDLYQGIVYFQIGRHFEALDLARKARDFFTKEGLKTKAVYAQLLVARIKLQLGGVSEASLEAQSAADMLGDVPAPWLDYQINYVMGDILEHQGDVPGARRWYRKAAQELEVLRTNIHVDELRMIFLKDKLKVYEGLVRTGLHSGDDISLREAFEAVEHAKSRTLVDLLANNISAVHPTRESDSQLVESLRTIRQELNWYYTRINLEEQKAHRGSTPAVQTLIDEVHKREDQLIRLLRQVSSESVNYLTLQRVTTSSLEEIQASLANDAVLVEYYAVDDRVLAFAITREDFKIFPDIAIERSLKTSFEFLRFQLTKFNLGQAYMEQFSGKMLDAVKEHLHELYQELIPPLANVLQGRRSIVFVPHGFMHYLPFHALFDGKRFLIDDYEISYAPSATIFRSCIPNEGNGDGSPLVIGVPDPRAPQILEEVQSIAGIFTNPRVFVGEAATAERLRQNARDASVIHIASHGSFRNDNPMFSSIQLGDSRLSLFDIYNLKTSASLVTLSGCGTGMSKVVAGDELLGLVRGFLYAGARSLVVSLWDVHDTTTATLMKSFYGQLASGHARWQSLRSAILDLKVTHPHPYYWAPFIGIGGP